MTLSPHEDDGVSMAITQSYVVAAPSNIVPSTGISAKTMTRELRRIVTD